MSEALLGASPGGAGGACDPTDRSLCGALCVLRSGASCLSTALIVTRTLQGSCCYYPV